MSYFHNLLNTLDVPGAKKNYNCNTIETYLIADLVKKILYLLSSFMKYLEHLTFITL